MTQELRFWVERAEWRAQAFPDYAESGDFIFCHLCGAVVPINAARLPLPDHRCIGSQFFLTTPFGSGPTDCISRVVSTAEALNVAPLVIEGVWMNYGVASHHEATLRETWQEWCARMNGFYYTREGEIWGLFDRSPDQDIVPHSPAPKQPWFERDVTWIALVYTLVAAVGLVILYYH